jgi:hypothetical protein
LVCAAITSMLVMTAARRVTVKVVIGPVQQTVAVLTARQDPHNRQAAAMTSSILAYTSAVVELLQQLSSLSVLHAFLMCLFDFFMMLPARRALPTSSGHCQSCSCSRLQPGCITGQLPHVGFCPR